MLRRTLTFTLLCSMLTASAAIPFAAASTNGESQAAPRQSASKVERADDEVNKSVTLDAEGRVAKVIVPVAEGKKISFGFEYDKQDRIEYITPEGGDRMRLDYDPAGQWQGFSFPDGGRLAFVRDRAGNITGIKQMAKPAPSRTPRLKNTVGRVVYNLNVAPDCEGAAKRATDAVVAAALVCATAGPVACTAALAFAAYLTYEAYKACGGEIAAEEQAA